MAKASKKTVLPFEVRSVVICDDVRQEVGGKWIYIGVYADAMIFNGFPAKLAKLVAVVTLRLAGNEKDISFWVSPKPGVEKSRVQFAIPKNVKDGQVVFMLDMRNVKFEEPGTFKFCLKIKRTTVEYWALDIREAQTEEERRLTSL